VKHWFTNRFTSWNGFPETLPLRACASVNHAMRSLIPPLVAGVVVILALVLAVPTHAVGVTTLPNASMAQNATCTAAGRVINVTLFIYGRVYGIANGTGLLNTVSGNLSRARSLVDEARGALASGDCFTALKDAVEAMHIEQGVWSTVVRGYARGRHLNITEAVRAEAELRVLNRTLAIALRIANETGNQTLVNELKGLINQVKLAGELIKAGNYTGALKVLSSVKESIHNLAKQVHEEARKWAEEYKALHRHGKGGEHSKPTHGKGQGGGSNSGNGGSGKGHH